MGRKEKYTPTPLAGRKAHRIGGKNPRAPLKTIGCPVCHLKHGPEGCAPGTFANQMMPHVPTEKVSSATDSVSAPPPTTPNVLDRNPEVTILGNKIARCFGLESLPAAWRTTISSMRALGYDEETLLGTTYFGLNDVTFWAARIGSVEKLYEFMKSGSLINAYLGAKRQRDLENANARCPHKCCVGTCSPTCERCQAKKGCRKCGGTVGWVSTRLPYGRDVMNACECTGLQKTVKELLEIYPPPKNDGEDFEREHDDGIVL